jgi:hypothetical protein
MPPQRVAPIILGSERDEGGALWLWLRLSDGRTGWVRWTGPLPDERHISEADKALLGRLVPTPPVGR